MNRNRLMLGAGAVASAAALTLAATSLPAVAGKHPRPTGGPTTTVVAPAPTSASYGYSLTVTGLPSTTGPLTVSGTATFDLVGKKAQITANPSQAVGPIGTGTITAVVVDKTAYLSAPSLSVFTGGKPWVSTSGQAMAGAGPATALWGRLGSAIANVPSAIRWATTHPARHALATVTSTSTSGGSTVTDLQLLLPHGKAKASGHGLPTTLPITVTADAQGRLSAISSSFSAAGVAISFSATSTGFDAPTSITVPAASDTLALSPGMLSMISGLVGLPGHAKLGPAAAAHVAASGLSAQVHRASAKVTGWLHSLDRDDR
jgi:hypothetical protein